jgi:hypothetical protein
MTAVKDMSLDEAAGTAIALVLTRDESANWLANALEDWEVDSVEELGSDAWQEAKYEGAEETRGNLTAKVVAEYGGEGKGDQYWMVVSLSDSETTRYFRKDGWYSSYGEGGSLDGNTYEVFPAEKVVVVYE